MKPSSLGPMRASSTPLRASRTEIRSPASSAKLRSRMDSGAVVGLRSVPISVFRPNTTAAMENITSANAE
jgi:hypothetical protein